MVLRVRHIQRVVDQGEAVRLEERARVVAIRTSRQHWRPVQAKFLHPTVPSVGDVNVSAVAGESAREGELGRTRLRAVPAVSRDADQLCRLARRRDADQTM
eukprot:5193627-Prymnesium_polylepis.2